MLSKLKKIILFFSLPMACVSQNDTVLKTQKFFFGINAGFNFSKISSDTINFSYGTKPVIGLYTRHAISKTIYLKNSVLYSIKGSTCTTPYSKFENTYLDVNVIPEYKFSNDFYLQTGISYSQFLYSKRIKNSGETKTGVKRFDNGKFVSEINIVTGIALKLQRNIDLEFDYFIPTFKKNTNNFQLSLTILLNNKVKKERYIKTNRSKSKEQINQLKNGVLLVRLKTSENKINALRKSGATGDAENVKLRQEIENKKIVSAFRNHYNFSKVLFFYNNKSNKIRKKEFDNIFLNDTLSVDSSIIIDKNKPIFIAEFAAIEQDTAKYYSHSTYEPDGNWSLKELKHYYGGPNPGFDALIIRDENFIQLKKPFPYYTRAIFNSVKQHPEQVLFLSIPFPIILFQNWSYNQTVKRMNVKLFNYYEKIQDNKK